MKRLGEIAAIAIVAVGSSFPAAAKDGGAEWIYSADSQSRHGQMMRLQHAANIESVPAKAEVRVAADSKYWLTVNGETIVREGGVKRGPNPHDTYYDSFDIAPYLKPGENLISAEVWYWGHPGFSYNPSGKAGFFFDCDALPELRSSREWRGSLNPAHYIPSGLTPNKRLPQSNIGYDSRREEAGWECVPHPDWKNVKSEGAEGCKPWGRLHHRVIPMWRDYGLKPYLSKEVRRGEKCDTLVCRLPYNAQVSPQMRINGPAGRIVEIMTDNYMGGGEPNVRTEYITSGNAADYENKDWMNGECVWYIYPHDVEITDVNFRETGYDCDFSGTFGCSDDFLNRFRQKASRTLYVTMRDTYMDCPDRERAQWWGDAVNESGEAFYALSRSADALMRKGMYELIGWQRPDGSIFSPVPAGNWDRELPGQMLASIGHYGFWNYYLNTGDLKTIADLYPGVKRYMSIWKKAADGTMVAREGGWHWGDWGENIDKTAIYNMLYVLAQRGMMEMADALGYEQDADSIAAEMKALKEAINSSFLTPEGYRAHDYKDCIDDRAQALAVVAGVAGEEQYPLMLKVLEQCEHASPYMEKYVTEAYFLMKEGEKGLARMKRRFGPMVDNKEHSTLFEGWGIGSEGFGGGTSNHAWSGGGLTILSQYVCGISPLKPGYEEFLVAPELSGLEWIETVVPTVKGDIPFEALDKAGKLTFSFRVPEGTTAIVRLPEGYEGKISGGRRFGKETRLSKAGSYKVEARRIEQK